MYCVPCTASHVRRNLQDALLGTLHMGRPLWDAPYGTLFELVVEFYAGLVDHLPPLLDLGGDALAEVGGAARDDFQALRGENLAHLGRLQRARRLLVDAAHG